MTPPATDSCGGLASSMSFAAAAVVQLASLSSAAGSYLSVRMALLCPLAAPELKVRVQLKPAQQLVPKHRGRPWLNSQRMPGFVAENKLDVLMRSGVWNKLQQETG